MDKKPPQKNVKKVTNEASYADRLKKVLDERRFRMQIFAEFMADEVQIYE